jgi:hypothetical protein
MAIAWVFQLVQSPGLLTGARLDSRSGGSARPTHQLCLHSARNGAPEKLCFFALLWSRPLVVSMQVYKIAVWIDDRRKAAK